jgi:hypothetical protein
MKVIRKIMSNAGILNLNVWKLKCLNSVVPRIKAIISHIKFIPFLLSIPIYSYFIKSINIPKMIAANVKVNIPKKYAKKAFT